MVARNAMLPAPKLKLAHRREVKGITGKTVALRDRVDLLQPALRAIALRDRDGAVERDDRGRTDSHQRVVKRHDRLPIRVLGLGSGRVDRGDGRLQMVWGQLAASGRELQELEALEHELA